ncbi:type I restriction-modification system subunit M [Tamlana agarivorans]|uniref:Type I restriction-modification system subunit M n=1 Tax=Pseudotamlana agarivorans TaxID=481183 RepID=A0ACC5UAR8_9FLAO|nr:type I restriction-modification system subunit M [Tamlana agarivorans]MBU2951414.1 type I restriction-modification system subunit M [Tamlana agarivorans]
MTDQKQQLEQQLWNIANTLRGKMDADDFRDYILGFIFYKYLSKKMELYANEILEADGITFADVEGHEQEAELLEALKDAALDKLGYFLAPSELFSELARRGNAGGKNQFILGDLSKVLTHIEQSTMGSDSEDDFGNLFEDIDLTSSKLGKSENDKNELIVKVLSHLDQIDFDLQNTESDILGDAYEYLIGQFASGAGKKAGEFYTPQQVSKVLSKIVTVGKDQLKSVYDPTCGSGSLLLRVANEVEHVAGFFGQEMNPTTYNLCRMNMIMHDVHYNSFDIKNEDTLEKPQHEDLRFEAIVANPPFSAKWSASPLFMSDDRFSAYGKLAPSSKADFAFVQHMIYQLADNGTMAIVLPHGVLFRGAAEGHIRKFLIKDRNYLDAVIGLPANIFYGTSIPTAILVFKKDRKNKDKILFIDASAHFEKVKTQNYLREADINKIADTYKTYTCHAEQSEEAHEAIDKYSYVASLSEIQENDYNLNIPRYVDTFEEEEPVDLTAVSANLKQLDQDMKQVDHTIADFCKQLDINTPF